MINLIINEMIKVVKKKGFIILLIIMAGYTLLTNVLYKVMFNDINNIIDQRYENVEEDYKYAKESYEKNKSDLLIRDDYIDAKTKYDILQYKKQFRKNSWQEQYLDTNTDLEILLMTINNYEIANEGTKEEYDLAKVNLVNLTEKLKSSDWKDIAKEQKTILENKIKILDDAIKARSLTEKNGTDENKNDIVGKMNIIDNINDLENYSVKDLEMNKKLYEIELDTLNIQLEKNISYVDELKYVELKDYQESREILLGYEGSNLDRASEEEKESYYMQREEYFNHKYNVEHIEQYNAIDMNTVFKEFYENYLLMIVIFIFLIAGPMISQEFSKGTIKLLLVKPYSRTKILLSKYIVTLISILMAMVIMILLQLVIGGLIFGFNSLFNDIVVYSSLTDSVQYYNVFKYILLVSIGKLPHFIILASLAFAVSSITNNTAVSIITGFVGYMGTNILAALLVNIDKPWVKYCICFHWNFKNYIFNLRPEISGINFGMSIMICIITLLVLMVPSFIVFKHKDIKNI